MNDMTGLTKNEVIEILISLVALSLSVTVLERGGMQASSMLSFLTVFFIFFFTIGPGFILHELAHKYVAMEFGAYARYRLWHFGLLFMLFTAVFLGFVFAAPGAVYIYAKKSMTRRENGLISLAGPATNIAISLFFLALTVFFPVGYGGVNIWYVGFKINSFLAFFNMLPLYPLDGSKVLSWSGISWVGVTAFSFFLTFLI